MNLELKDINEIATSDIELFLNQFRQSLIYYSPNYLKFLGSFINVRNISKVAIDNKNQIMGFLPLLCKSGPYGDVINSLPFFGSNGGIISKTKDADKKLLNYFNNFSDKNKWFPLNLDLKSIQ